MNGFYQQTPNQYISPYTRQTYTQPTQNGITWVQGIEGAKAYQLAPSTNTILLDSESDHFYIKTSDNIGMCNLRTFKFEEITNSPKEEKIDVTQYVTRTEFQEFINSLGGKKNEQPIQPAERKSTK